MLHIEIIHIIWGFFYILISHVSSILIHQEALPAASAQDSHVKLSGLSWMDGSSNEIFAKASLTNIT